MASSEKLDSRLAAVERDIAAHAYSSADVIAAHQVIESQNPRDNDAISAELLAKGLPSLEQLGRITAKGLFSWGRLHRNRKKLLRKITKLENLG